MHKQMTDLLFRCFLDLFQPTEGQALAALPHHAWLAVSPKTRGIPPGSHPPHPRLIDPIACVRHTALRPASLS